MSFFRKIYCLSALLLMPFISRTADCYVWQRKHTAAVREAVAGFEKNQRGMIWFLAGELENDQSVSTVSVPRFVTPARAGAAVRVHIGNMVKSPAALAMEIGKIFEPWSATGFRNFQVDMDAPESKLEYYAAVMRELRKNLPLKSTLSATVLPCHVRHRERFRLLAEECDFFVLQLHWLHRSNGRYTLMERDTAVRGMIDAMQIGGKFKIALPAYACRSEDGIVVPDFGLTAQLARMARSWKVGIIAFRLGNSDDGLALDRESMIELCSGRVPEEKILLRWEKNRYGAYVLSISTAGGFAERCVLQCRYDGIKIDDYDMFNGAVAESSGKMPLEKITLLLPPAGSWKKVMWLRTAGDESPENKFYLVRQKKQQERNTLVK